MLAKGETPMKIGPVKALPQMDGTYVPYGGGIAFRSVSAAVDWAREKGKADWVPFELDGVWPDDVVFVSSDGFHRIVRDLPIMREVVCVPTD